MFNNYVKYIYLSVFALVAFSCATDEDSYVPIQIDPIQVSPVIFDIESVPYQTLSEYNFFDGNLSDINPVYGVLPYDLNSSLFTDYAHKKRFIWMPDGQSANYLNDYSVIDFPIGTVFIKNFYYDDVLPDVTTLLIETRLMILKESGWVFANYVWNDDLTEASFDLSGSFKAFDFLLENETQFVNYRIPAESKCFTCHKSIEAETALPIGPKPQNLNKSYTYADGQMNQLQKWVEMGYLDSYPLNIESLVNWEDDSQPLELRVRSYLDINCAHCHSDNGHCDYRPVRFAFNESSDISNLGVCVEAHTVFDPLLTYIVNPGNADTSVLIARLISTEEFLRMPLFGRTLKHNAGVALIEEWINSLNINCN
ncbi:hypothetical protein A9Q87_11080 [Flavobacteriales bacterium 34_180_T64]|nr:hypothetical protein A9Q87_11080 [Flavobacteriales bacterium 34_180_T64]